MGRLIHRIAVASPPPEITQAVWVLISEDPSIPLDGIVGQIGITKSMAWRALRTLRDVYGYIDYPDETRCARQILIPFVVTKKAKH